MKKYFKKPLTMLLIGALIILIGGLLKVLKHENSDILLVIGILIEIIAVWFYFWNRENK